jgi:hypothetical protein
MERAIASVVIGTILGSRSSEVIRWMRNDANKERLINAGLTTQTTLDRGLMAQVEGQELVRLRGATKGLDSILDRNGMDINQYYNTIIPFYETSNGRAFKRDMDRWSANASENQIATATVLIHDAAREGMTPQELARVRREIGLPSSAPVAPATTSGGAAARRQPPSIEPITTTVGGGNTSRTPENPNRRLTADEIRELERDINRLSPRMVDAEQTAIQTLIRNEKAERDGITVAEANEIRNRANQFSTQRGNQASSPSPRATTIADPVPEPEAGRVTASPEANNSADAGAEPSATTRISSGIQEGLTGSTLQDATSFYDSMISTIAEQLKNQFSGMEMENDINTWENAMKDPTNKAQFINQYRNDPAFRDSFNNLADTLNDMGERGQEGGATGFLADMMGIRGRAQGIIRDFIGTPQNMLNREELDRTRQKMADLGNPFSGILQSFAGMFGINGMDQLHGIWDGIKNAFSGLFGNIGAAFGEGGGGIGGLFGNLFGAGNGGGANIGGLLASIDRSMGVAPQTPAPAAGASAGASAPTNTNERPPPSAAPGTPAPQTQIGPSAS